MPWASGVEFCHSSVGQYTGSGTGMDIDFCVLQPVTVIARSNQDTGNFSGCHSELLIYSTIYLGRTSYISYFADFAFCS